MSSRPTPLISYAQNGEDIVLARALRPWEKKGFWVDCGAGHPKYNSVTMLFSQLGWTGINIEPLAGEFMLLSQDRPQDENIQCLLGAQGGTGTIYAGPIQNRGSSTSDPSLVERYEKEFGQSFSQTEVSVRRLDEILRQRQRPPIDFLKIDVEGAEETVLQGINLVEFRPRILVIEATKPNSDELSHEPWEHYVLDSGYVCALFDGLNRFYVAEGDAELFSLLKSPVNVLDNYKTILQSELEQVGESSQRAVNAYIEQINNAQQFSESLEFELNKTKRYVESLHIGLQDSERRIADHRQEAIDADIQNTLLRKANEALEENLLKLHDVERQLATIRSYRLFKLLSFAKKVLRKATGRK